MTPVQRVISDRYLVVSRGPEETMHFDLVVAPTREGAEQRVLDRRAEGVVPAAEVGTGAIALSRREVWEIWIAMTAKSDQGIEDRFQSIPSL